VSFNSDFWVTTGTIAPVISLSCIVLINDQFNVWSDARARKLFVVKPRLTAYNTAAISYVVNCVNLLIQAVVLYNALDGLATRTNFSPERVTAVIETFSVLLLFAASGLIIVSKSVFKEDENRRLEEDENRRLALKSPPVSGRRKIRRKTKASNAELAVIRRHRLQGKAKRATSVPERAEDCGR
jgi:hypothetical protein